MLNHELIHPPLLEALATAGHGSRILLADGNYPYLTMVNPAARLVHLNLAPGLLTVTDVLPLIQTAVNFESAAVMRPAEGVDASVQEEYRRQLGDDVPMELVDRFDFYDLVRSPEVGLVVATGEVRLYANLLLTIGLSSHRGG
ncbi:L-fucose mutarotase [Kribbella rubisoli]|jgi:L-fucose mutarotase|uniref:L-fucose mutarotase n=1 Tax=Kribbella rubisoli TaxID=3075929 RepID=A0A4Q7X2J0_9ACTN|nr:RbsD/FucU family protein [Kribbella rubisoli]RZU16279.1 L-fucose mutarotase [Kribbella rubisoli]